MLLRGTFSSTKKFFKTTIQTFKSFLSGGGYERLPKKSAGTAGLGELDNFYSDFTNQWDFRQENERKKGKTKSIEYLPKDNQKVLKGNSKEDRRTEEQNSSKTDGISSKQVEEKQEGGVSVMQRLKDLELMDKSNIDYALDIEEVLHYYSRLTSPAYLEIVDRFFMQMYSEFFQSTKSVHRDVSPVI